MNETLSAMVARNRLPHAMVLEGGTSSGRVSLAGELARALVCKAEAGKPCGQCSACRKALGGNHPDILFVAPEQGRKTISVETVRNMRDNAYILPNEADRKVYIIDPADTMQDYAQNALLKILEEPPEYATFLLLCASKASLLQTVLSRTAVFSLPPVAGADQDEKLVKEAGEAAVQIANALETGREVNLLSAVSFFENKYDLLPLALEQLGLLIRDALVAGAGGTGTISGQDDCVKRLSAAVPPSQLLSMAEALEDISTSINLHANKNLTLSRLCSRLAACRESSN